MHGFHLHCFAYLDFLRISLSILLVFTLPFWLRHMKVWGGVIINVDTLSTYSRLTLLLYPSLSCS
jgi:hypothetical protein